MKYAIHFCKSIDTDDYARVNLPSGEGDASGSSDSGELSDAGESDQVEPRKIQAKKSLIQINWVEPMSPNIIVKSKIIYIYSPHMNNPSFRNNMWIM